ncbi:tripartite tricarboxylate transporter TctB family protein [Hydrogenophaga sp. BPS33]|uniref:tripartite tricarboxylate transporter TctB family protein n=1 Tax=Hydrogenophaga sp. BPS33 TaxID=2651974 RepID=UPI00131F56A9|nr:tripartite tricarboxylate transporter TctB family protein [Hydrogenophaga sp. BPS33]QHE87343.1 tripartite tricarboxylate transporter TctB family protein [Hydrogenophaga sp. BPS33]
MQIKSRKDFASGLMFMLIGASFAIGATNYTIGSAARMGPAYFPLMLGILLCVLGAGVVFFSLIKGREDGAPIGRIAWKPVLLIIGANLLFGILLGGIQTLGVPAVGLIGAIVVAVVIASMAASEFRWRAALVLAAVLAVGSYLVFVLGLNLQFQVWPHFLAG